MSSTKTKPSIAELRKFYDEYPDPQVNFSRFVQRVTSIGWTNEQAITSPVRYTSKLACECHKFFETFPFEKCKVSYDTFYARVSSGWTMKKAATTPISNVTETLQKAYSKFKNPKVDFGVFYSRVHKNKWDHDRAANTPVKHRKKPEERSEKRQYYELNKDRAVVPISVFISRLRRNNWSLEDALTTPKISIYARSSESRRFYVTHPNPQVGYHTYIGRINKLNWSKEDAISTPSVPAKDDKVVNESSLSEAQRALRTLELQQFYETHKDDADVSLEVFMRRVCDDQMTPKVALKSLYKQPSADWSNSLHSAFF